MKPHKIRNALPTLMYLIGIILLSGGVLSLTFADKYIILSIIMIALGCATFVLIPAVHKKP